MNKTTVYEYIFVQVFCVNISFLFIQVNTEGHNCWIIWEEYVQVSKKLPNCLPKWLYSFAFLPAIKMSSAPHPCQHLVLSVVSMCIIQIDMCWYLILICSSFITMLTIFSYAYHRYIFFGEMSRSFAHFLIGFIFLTAFYEFFILDNSPLSNVPFANISPSLFFTEQKSILMKSSLSITSFVDRTLYLKVVIPRSSRFSPVIL